MKRMLGYRKTHIIITHYPRVVPWPLHNLMILAYPHISPLRLTQCNIPNDPTPLIRPFPSHNMLQRAIKLDKPDRTSAHPSSQDCRSARSCQSLTDPHELQVLTPPLMEAPHLGQEPCMFGGCAWDVGCGRGSSVEGGFLLWSRRCFSSSHGREDLLNPLVFAEMAIRDELSVAGAQVVALFVHVIFFLSSVCT